MGYFSFFFPSFPSERCENIDFSPSLWYTESMKKAKEYKYLLFDLDGTLIYSHPGIFSCFRHALKAMGRENPTDEALFPCIGPSLFYSFTTFFGMSEEEAERAVALYREEYVRTGVYENTPIEGSVEALASLSQVGYVLALATSKPLPMAEVISKKHGFAPYLTVSVGSGLDGSLPTKASVIAEAMRQLNASREECLMVGDRHYDAEGAAELGVDCALLKIGGYADEEELYTCGAKYVFADFAELTAFLCKSYE